MKKDTVFGSQDHPKATGRHVGKKPLTLVACLVYTERTFHAADTVAVIHMALAFLVTEFLKEMGLLSNTQTQKEQRLET